VKDYIGGHVRYLSNAVTRFFLVFSALLFSLPSVFAREYHTQLSPLNRVVATFAWLMDVPVLKNEYFQIYFVKFLLFIIFLAVAHWVFKKLFKDNKTSGVISASFAAIAAFLMPNNLVIVNGGLITLVFAGLIPLAIVGGGIYACVSKKILNKNFPLRLLAIIILFTLLYIIELYQIYLGIYTPKDVAPVFFFLPTMLWRGR
jgi:hypothetical protein